MECKKHSLALILAPYKLPNIDELYFVPFAKTGLTAARLPESRTPLGTTMPQDRRGRAVTCSTSRSRRRLSSAVGQTRSIALGTPLWWRRSVSACRLRPRETPDRRRHSRTSPLPSGCLACTTRVCGGGFARQRAEFAWITGYLTFAAGYRFD